MIQPYRLMGRVDKVIGLVIESFGPSASIGNLCNVTTGSGKVIQAEVVGFKGKKVLLMPLEETVGIEPGSYVQVSEQPYAVGVGRELLGRVLDGNGHPIDRKGPIRTHAVQPVHNAARR